MQQCTYCAALHLLCSKATTRGARTAFCVLLRVGLVFRFTQTYETRAARTEVVAALLRSRKGRPIEPNRTEPNLWVILVPSRTGVDPIALRTIHGPPMTLGMSLNLAFRSSEYGGGGASSIIPHPSPPKLLTGRLA